jgi:IMP cyclohydrolase
MDRISLEKAPSGLEEAMAGNLSALAANPYPGRGLIAGAEPAGKRFVQVYWIMGRSENSRNRVFKEFPDGSVRTEAHDPAKLSDPSLVIYAAARHFGKVWIVTNGNQTDTIETALKDGGSFESALMKREYEPDSPNFTPRISAIIDTSDAGEAYSLSILKRGPAGGCDRAFWRYEKALAGLGHFISTYAGDGNPLPPFAGEPLPMPIPSGGPNAVAAFYWDRLDAANRVSLMARAIDPVTGEHETAIVNAHG